MDGMKQFTWRIVLIDKMLQEKNSILFMTDDVNMDTGDIVDNDDADWYRQEVGKEPDPGKFFVCHILPPNL